MPIGTARMAHLSLPGSRLFEGVHFDDDPRLRDVFVDAAFSPTKVAVLFPGEQAQTVAQWPGPPPQRLIVLDGTWHHATKLLRENPRLAALPRLTCAPRAPGRYRIRKEPRDECLSTIEAVGMALSELEGDPALNERLLRPFDAMVEAQLRYGEDADRRREQASTSSPADVAQEPTRRHRGRGERRRHTRRFDELVPLLRHPERMVVVYAEANATPRHARGAGAPGLLHLLAARPFDAGPPPGDRAPADVGFDVVVKPAALVHDETLMRVGLSAKEFSDAVDPTSALDAFARWCGDDRWVCWGSFPRDVLAREGTALRGFVDLRALCCRALGGPAGGLLNAAARLGLVAAPHPQRGRRMLAAAMGILRLLMDEARREHLDTAPDQVVVS
jgi:DTW domain-containing protein YfiP